MKKFELKYELISEEFYEKFESRELGDDEDYLTWWSAIHTEKAFNHG